MFHGCKSLCLNSLKLPAKIDLKCMSALSKAEVRKRRNLLFEEEKRKQRSDVGRIEKIEVKYHSPIDEVTLMMNRGISTPHDVAQHISEGVTKVSALALVDDTPWDMHRPLLSDCKVKLVNLKSPEVRAVNYAFWRTCSLMLGAVIDNAFKDDINVQLYSFPYPSIKSGSFVYDVFLDLPEWKPTDAELRAMSSLFVKLSNKELPVERLDISERLALDMFQENQYKSEQIPDIAKHNENKVTVYRIGDHVDISKGPMVGNTRLVGRVTFTAVHKLESSDLQRLYRFQGVALPRGIILNQFAYSILEERARKLNRESWIPQQLDVEEDMVVSAKN